MTQDLTALIERLRAKGTPIFEDMLNAADALERLTQPVDVEPLNWSINTDGKKFPIYSAETVARLQQEHDKWKQTAAIQCKELSDVVIELGEVKKERDTLQGQVKLLRDAADMAHRYTKEYSPDGYVCRTLSEALAATEPKEKL